VRLWERAMAFEIFSLTFFLQSNNDFCDDIIIPEKLLRLWTNTENNITWVKKRVEDIAHEICVVL
jgi:hypothetical protein